MKRIYLIFVVLVGFGFNVNSQQYVDFFFNENITAQLRTPGYNSTPNCGEDMKPKHLYITNKTSNPVTVTGIIKIEYCQCCCDYQCWETEKRFELSISPNRESVVNDYYKPDSKVGYYQTLKFWIDEIKIPQSALTSSSSYEISQMQAQISQHIQPQPAGLQIIMLYGYLYIFPEDLGYFRSIPNNIISAVNNNVSYGYSDWRVPTIEEMALIKVNRSNILGLGTGEYLTYDGQHSGNLRLVRTESNTNIQNTLSSPQNNLPLASLTDVEESIRQTNKNTIENIVNKLDETVDVTFLISQANAYYNNKQYNSAVPLYKQAAEANNAEAQYKLGECYFRGWGITEDNIQAAHWYRKAAEQGNANAQDNLGYCYEKGWGVTQDNNQSIYWYEKAAKQGVINAKNALYRIRSNQP